MSKPRSPEEIFYDHLTLGLLRTLSNIPRVSNVWNENRLPCEKAQLANWEQRHSVYLPEDMKKFYLSTDGFLLQWSYQYAPNDIRRVGYIHIPHLLQILLLREDVEPTVTGPSASTSTTITTATSTAYIATTNTGTCTGTRGSSSSTSSSSLFHGTSKTILAKPSTSNVCLQETNVEASDGAVSADLDKSVAMALAQQAAPPPPPLPMAIQTLPKDIWGNPIPRITTKSKIFELNSINDVAKVCLVYETSGSNSPKLYLLELISMKWVFLADTFSEYLRMAVAHLGLPYWELCFSSFGLPSWAEQLFMLLAPHLLEEHEPRCDHLVNPAPEHPHNIIDPSVFRAKPKAMVKPSK